MDGHGAAEDRDSVEGLRKRHVAQPGRSADVIADGDRRLQVSVIKAEPIDRLSQLVS